MASIGERAFENCVGLVNLTLPSNLQQIDDKAFYDCESLREIHCSFTNLFDFNPNVFDGASGEIDYRKCLLYVPFGMTDAYRQHDVWGEFLNIVEEGGLRGDVTGDGKVDIGDVNAAIINIMLGK